MDILPNIMQSLINISIVIGTIAFMEAFSWFIHKYLFHGPLWFIHKTHHQQSTSWFELNDLFSMAFAAVALWLMWKGHQTFVYYFWIGTGISIYGIIYFVFHDWFIHSRIKAFRSANTYLSAIRKAHKVHHKSHQRLPAESYGLLWVNKKYFRNRN